MAARPGEIDQVRGPIEIAMRLSAQHMERMAGHVMGPQRQQRRELLGGMDMNQIVDDVIQKTLMDSMNVQAPPAPVPMPVRPHQYLQDLHLSPFSRALCLQGVFNVYR